MIDLLSTALKYAKRGWTVLPLHSPINGECDCGRPNCSSAAKHPRTSNGLKDATRDADIIKEWWRKWPSANIGVVTGKTSGIFVLDIDGEAGRKFLEGKNIPITVVSRTGKGWHYIFRHPGHPVKNSVRFAPELDIRGDGGYIIAPPSAHVSGVSYAWVDGMSPEEIELADAPSFLLEMVSNNQNGVCRNELNGDLISEGKRNGYLTSQAGAMRRRNMTENSILVALVEENKTRCNPPLEEAEVRRIAQSVASYGPEPIQTKRESQSTRLIKMAEGLRLFHSGDQCFATISRGDHSETWPLSSKGFRYWLAHQFFNQDGKSAGSIAIQDAIDTLKGKAQFQGPEHKVFRRLAHHDGKTYIDLANEKWQAVEVTGEGWRVVSNPPVKFIRARGMLPLPIPQPGGTIDELRQFVNVTDRDWPLFVGWMIGAYRSKGPYTILILQGEQGTAKSTLARMARDLIDPNSTPLRSEPREVRDLMISAANGWVVAFDNLSRLSPNLSDALCRLSTGGGFSTRELYSDDEEKLFEAERPIILNGIEELATRGDLSERSIVLFLSVISEEKRQPLEILNARFEAARPRILGALWDAVSSAIKNEPSTMLDRYPRMADFARWVSAAEPALGWEPGSFAKAYGDNRLESNESSLGASPITAPLLKFIPVGKWEGTATELLNALNPFTEDSVRNTKIWPRNGTRLSNMLRRLAPHLRPIGLDVSFERNPDRRLIKLEQKGKVASSPSSASSTHDGNDANDAHDALFPLCSEQDSQTMGGEDES